MQCKKKKLTTRRCENSTLCTRIGKGKSSLNMTGEVNGQLLVKSGEMVADTAKTNSMAPKGSSAILLHSMQSRHRKLQLNVPCEETPIYFSVPM